MLQQVLVQNTGAFTGTPSGPTAVDEGKLALFNAATGASVDMSSGSLPAEFIIVRGVASGSMPDKTAIIKSADATITKQAYVAQVKEKMSVASPTLGASETEFIVKVIVTNGQFQEFVPTQEIHNVEVTVAAGASASTILDAIADAVEAESRVPVRGYTNQQWSVTLTGIAADSSVTIDGTSYTITFDTNADTTGAAFVTASAADILADEGVTVTYDSGTDKLLFDSYRGSLPTISSPLTDAEETALSKALFEAEGDETFSLAADNITVTVAREANAVYGNGLGSQVRAAEQKAWASHAGIYERPATTEVADDPSEVSYQASASGLYTQYLISVPTNAQNNGFGPNVATDYEILVAIEKDDTTGDLDTVFAI